MKWIDSLTLFFSSVIGSAAGAISIATLQDPVVVFCLIFLGGGFGGVFALLRNNRMELTKRNLLSSFGNSGFIALVIALIWWTRFSKENVHTLIGFCFFFALLGPIALKIGQALVEKRLNIKISSTENDEQSPPPSQDQ